MTDTQTDVMYYTACAFCGVAISNLRVPEGSDFFHLRSRAACPACYAQPLSALLDVEVSDETSNAAL